MSGGESNAKGTSMRHQRTLRAVGQRSRGFVPRGF